MHTPVVYDALAGRRVAVYWNLHRDCFSVVALTGGEEKGRVIAHVDAIDLAEVTFTVAPAGRDLVRASGAKNVHARVRGVVARSVTADCPTPVTYNPYRDDSFVRRDTLAPVTTALAARLRTYNNKPLVSAALNG